MNRNTVAKFLIMFNLALLSCLLLLDILFHTISLYLFISNIILLILGLYLHVYDLYKAPYTINSLICFYINTLIFFSYITLFYKLAFGFTKPIYVENLSIFSQYRYLIFVICSVIFFCMCMLVRFSIRSQSFFNTLLLYIPSLKEEVRLLLYNYNDSWLGDLCVYLTDSLYDKRLLRYLYIFFHFLLYYVFNAFRLYLFILFVFLHHDLRFLLYLAPLSFFAWLLKFIFYYHYWFVTANLNAVKEFCNVQLTKPIVADDYDLVTIRSWEDLEVQLTPLGIEHGYNHDDLFFLKDKFLRLSVVKVLLSRYYAISRLLDYFFMAFYFICWCYIVYHFFFFTNSEDLVAMGLISLFRRSSSYASNQPVFYPRDYRFLNNPKKEHELEKSTVNSNVVLRNRKPMDHEIWTKPIPPNYTNLQKTNKTMSEITKIGQKPDIIASTSHSYSNDKKPLSQCNTPKDYEHWNYPPAKSKISLYETITGLTLQDKPITNSLTENELNAKVQNQSDLFKSLSTQIKYTPVIFKDTNINNLSDSEIVLFLKERGLLKNISDNEPKGIVEILINPEGSLFIGIRKNNHKLTAYGGAYHEKVIVKRYTPTEDSSQEFDINIKPDIIIVKPSGAPSIVETSGLLHLLLAYQKGDYYYVSGTLTSTSKGKQEVVSKIQYKDFETQKECGISHDAIVPGQKLQCFIPKNHLGIIHKNNVFVTKWSEEYLAFIKKMDYFKYRLDIQKEAPCVPFDDIGVTKQEGLDMCLDMDYNVAKAQKHPTTIGHKTKVMKSMESPKSTQMQDEL